MATTARATNIDSKDWALLLLLSVLWGAAFFFAGVAVTELPPFTVVLSRVAIAACLLVPLHWLLQGRLPRGWARWWPFFVMGLINNVIPFSLVVTGQQWIASGLASVINATTPLFTALVMAAFGEERLLARRVVGVGLGIAGVVVLSGQRLDADTCRVEGIVLCLGAALSYAFAGLWGRRRLLNVPPLTSATCQLICSAAVMIVLAGSIDRPWTLPMPSLTLWATLFGFAVLSTALAYIVFFKILVRSGASNVMLVTLLIPVTSISLGSLILGEALVGREIAGAFIIASSLLVIDGRILSLLRRGSGEA